MQTSHFNHYFQLTCSSSEFTPLLSARLLQLRDKLFAHQTDILTQLEHFSDVKIFIKDLAHWLNDFYASWIEVIAPTDLTDDPLKHWFALYQQDHQLTYTQFNQIGQVCVSAAQNYMEDNELLWCTLRIQSTTQALTQFVERQTIGEMSASLAKRLIDEIRMVKKLDLSEEGQVIDLNAFEQSLIHLLTQWGTVQVDADIVAELEFIHLFAVHLITPHPASSRLWELLLLKLDRIFNELVPGQLQHVLTNTIEVLISSVDRFQFVRHFVKSVLPLYPDYQAPVGESLLLLLFLQTRPTAPLSIQFTRNIACQTWLTQITVLLENLNQKHREALEILRPHWERTQLDWFSEATERLDHLLTTLHATQILLDQTKGWCQNFSRSLTEGLTDEQGRQQAAILLQTLLQIACFSAAASDNPQISRDLFRYRITLFLAPDKKGVIWKKYREVSLALQRVEASEGNTLLPLIRPLFGSLEGILQDNLAYSLRWFTELTELKEILPTLSHHTQEGRELIATLQQLAIFQRLYNTQQAVLMLKAWFAQNMSLDTKTLQTVPTLLTQIYQHLSHTTTALPNELRQVLQTFVEILPDVTAAKRLAMQIKTIATLATMPVYTTCPEYVEKVGAIGMQSAVIDNSFTLMKIVQVLTSPITNPKETLLWWWNTSVATYLATRMKRAFEANLLGFQHALQHKLPIQAESECIFQLISTIYMESLGVDLPKPATEQLSIQFFDFEIKGQLWQRLFTAERPKPTHLVIMQAALPILVAPEPIVREPLTIFVQIFSECGDEEVAWQAAQPLFEQALSTTTTDNLEVAWRRLLYRLPGALPLTQSGYWTNVLYRGINIIRQVGLGRKLAEQTVDLAQDMANRLATIIREPSKIRNVNEKKGQRDLHLFLNHFAHCLRTQPPTLAALNIGRFLVEGIAPFVTYPAYVWHLAWLHLEEILLPNLDQVEQLVLHRWIAQLDALSTYLPETNALGKTIFHVKEFIFAERQTVEQEWRDCVSGLLTAAITQKNAPISGQAMIQRLLLVSPIFTNETAASWQTRQTALATAFANQLTQPLSTLLAQRQATLVSSLLQLKSLTELPTLRGVDLFCILLSALPYTQQLWKNELWIQSTDTFPNLSQDLFIAQATRWQCPEISQLRNMTITYQAAYEFDTEMNAQSGKWFLPKITSQTALNLSESQRHTLKMLLRLLVLETELTETDNINLLLFDFLHPLKTIHSEQTLALLTGWMNAVIARYGKQHSLSMRCQQLLRKIPAVILAKRFLNQEQALAKMVVEQLKPYQSANLQADKTAATIRDVHFVLRRIALHFSGLSPCHDLANWYIQQVGFFLQPETRQLATWFLPQIQKILRNKLTKEEFILLESAMTEMCQAFEITNWPVQPQLQLEITS